MNPIETTNTNFNTKNYIPENKNIDIGGGEEHRMMKSEVAGCVIISLRKKEKSLGIRLIYFIIQTSSRPPPKVHFQKYYYSIKQNQNTTKYTINCKILH